MFPFCPLCVSGKNTLIITSRAKITIKTPVTLFIQNKFLSLILLLNRLIIVIKRSHQIRAPANTDAIRILIFVEFSFDSIILKLEKMSPKAKIVIGFEIVMRKLVIKSEKNLFP